MTIPPDPHPEQIEALGLTANTMDLVEGVCVPLKALSPDYNPLNSYVTDNLPRWIIDGWTYGNEQWEEASEQMQEWATNAARAVTEGIRADMESLEPDASLANRPADDREEYMSVSINRQGTVTSYNAYDANFDEMVEATRQIIIALQERLANRVRCPFASGKELRALPSQPEGVKRP